jgi:hypothetical protein
MGMPRYAQQMKLPRRRIETTGDWSKNYSKEKIQNPDTAIQKIDSKGVCVQWHASVLWNPVAP